MSNCTSGYPCTCSICECNCAICKSSRGDLSQLIEEIGSIEIDEGYRAGEWKASTILTEISQEISATFDSPDKAVRGLYLKWRQATRDA